MAPVAIGTAKTIRKCIKSVVQVCNGNEKQPRTPGYTLNLSGEFFPSGEIRIATNRRPRRSLALETARSTIKTKTMRTFLA